MSEESNEPNEVQTSAHTDNEAQAETKQPPQKDFNIGTDESIAREMGRRSRRGFLVAGVATIAGYAGWRLLGSQTEIGGLSSPLRSTLQFNERLSSAYASTARLAPTFDRARAVDPRVNGGEGMSDDFDPALWRLQVIGVADAAKYAQYRTDVSYQPFSNETDASADDDAGQDDESTKDNDDSDGETQDDASAHPAAEDFKQAGLLLTLDDIKKLPRVEMTTELKCIEGWSVIVNWAGARLADFISNYQPLTRNNTAPDVRARPHDLVRYVNLETPDGGYYVGLDLESALHPQTLLCYELNGQPLSLEHGAPLRLVTPTKYGIKNIKRIGRISFTDERPADYWAERGYDWYAGH